MKKKTTENEFFEENGVIESEIEEVVLKQMPPVVQPIAIVPYNTMQQPLYTYDYDDDGDDYDYNVDVPVENKQTKKQQESSKTTTKVKASGVSIVLFILSIVSLFVLIGGEYVKLEMLYLYNDVSGITKALQVMKAFEAEQLVLSDLLFPLSAALVIVCDVIVALSSLLSIKRKGANAFMKLFVFIALISSGLLLAMIAKAGYEFAYGSIIVVGIAAVSMLIAMFSKSRR